MKASNANKVVSVLLSVAMCPMMVPSAAFAADDDATSDASSPSEQTQSADQAEASSTSASSSDTIAPQSDSADASTGEAAPAATATVNGYSTLEEAVQNATVDAQGVITYEVTGKVNVDSTGWVQVRPTAATNAKVVKFVGKSSDAEICITQGVAILADQKDSALSVEFSNLKLSKLNPMWAQDFGHSTNYFTTWLRNTDAASSCVTYTNCEFPNGVCNNQYGKTVFDSCTFSNATSGLYSMWVYGGNVEVKGGSFTGVRGVKVFTEGTATIAPKVAIEGTSFKGVPEKAAIVVSKPAAVTLSNVSATDCAKGLIQKDIEGSSEKVTLNANGMGIGGSFNITANTGSDATKAEFNLKAGTLTSEVSSDFLADGFTLSNNGDGTYGVAEATPAAVAEVNGKSYSSLQAAIDAAPREATVKLLADTKENVTISTPYVMLDLNGYTLNGGTVAGKPALTVTARVTVKDSSETQTGTIKREDTAENSGVSSHYVIDIQGAGWLTFESGNVTNNSGNASGKGASLVRVGDDSVAKYPGLNIKGGTFTQNDFIVIKVDRGDLFLNGGTLNSRDSYAIEDWHRATIKGGTVNGTVAAWTYSGGHNSDLSISGGTVNGNVFSVNYGSAEDKVAKVSITGGSVNGTLGTYTYNNGLAATTDAAKATIEITGGTFKEDPTKYVVEDCAINKNEDGTYGVEKAYLARVGETSYYTMDEAFKAQTTSGEAITLLRDYTTGSTFNSGTVARVVDLNGHTWTCTGTDANSAAFEINNPNASLTVKNGKVVSSQLIGLIPSAMGGTITYDNSTLTFEGVEASTTATSGIETNGNNTNDTVILKDSTLNVPNGFGIYFPSSGTLTIDNSKINAKTMGAQVCSGNLNVDAGSTITVSGDPVEKTEGDGAIQDGAAISIVNRAGYKGLGKIAITGGTFTAKGNNAAIKAYDWANQTETDFTKDDNVSISGGTFSSAVGKSLCADGFIPTKNANGTYGVKEGADGYVEDENGNATISTAEGLFYFAKKANAGNDFAGKTVTLANDIDLNNEKWTPIGSYGDSTTHFKGTFDGQNHTVAGLNVVEYNKNGVGFFGKVYTGTIKNLTVEGSVSAPGCSYVGGIVGHGYATIANCTFKGTVSGSGAAQVGGIAGSGGFTVDRCSVYGDVSAGCWAGGIVGNCQDGGAYTNCYVEGVVSAERTYWGGGAAGITPVPLYPSQVISGCYSNTVVKVAGKEVNCPIIAAYNNPLDYNGYSGDLKIYDNSWNKQKNSNDSYPIYAEKGGVGGVLMDGMTAARDNSLIMLEDDLNYVTGDLSKVRVMAGSSVTQAQIDALAVASVGDSKYQSLTEAVAAAQDGETVTLLTDAAEDVAISKSITLDLGCKTLTNTNTGKATISVKSGIVTVKNGNVVGGTGYYNIEVTKNSNANLTLTDVTATAGNTGSSMIDNWGTMTITSGTYTGGLDVVKSEEGSKLTITGGTFTLNYATNGYTGVIFAYGDTTISGGEFIQNVTTTGRWNHPQVVATGVVEGYTSITRVTGGNFVNKKSGEKIFRGVGKATSDNFEVSGGTFNKEVSEDYCADGFIPTKNSDGTYGVKEGHYVAQVGSTKYETLADAIRLAANGKTIQLLTDATENITIAENKRITLDLNGHTLNGGTGTAKAAILNKGTVTITDTSAGKTGTIKRDDQGVAGETSYYVIDNNGTMVIDQANVVNNSGAKGSSLIRNGGVDNVSSLTINGGTFEQQNFIAVKNDGNGELTINGGTLTSKQSVVQNWNKAQILGGNLTGIIWTDSLTEAGTVGETVIGGDTHFTGRIYMDVTSPNPSTLKIEGGSLDVTKWTVTSAAAEAGATIAVSGGTFTAAVPENYCAAGYVPTDNADGTYGVTVGKFTVQVTSRTTTSGSPVANVSGGGSDVTYAEGTTVTASAISGYNFVGWFVNEYAGTPYSTDLTCTVKPTDNCTMIAVYEPISGGKFWLTVTASEFTVNGGAVQDSYLYEQYAIGTSVTVNFTGTENFLYWVNASNKVVSTDKSYTFTMGSETALKAVYGKARQNQATVVFISHSDQIISSKAYTTSDTIQFPVPPIKMGCTFTGWSMTEADIHEAMANNNGIIQVRALYTEPSIDCAVTVVYPEGTDNEVVNAKVGELVNVTAKDIEGKTFSCWTDNDGNVLGYTKTLKLAPSGDMTVKAIYSDEAAEAKPVISLSEVSASKANEGYVVTFMATRAVPEGYQVVKQGILWSREAACGEDGAAAYMQFDSNGKLPTGINAYIGNSLELNGVTRLDITTKYSDRTFYGRGYMILKSDAGELLYIYTDTIASGSYDSLAK